MWDLPGPDLKPMSPAFAGGFLTTAPPGKSNGESFKMKTLCFAEHSGGLGYKH